MKNEQENSAIYYIIHEKSFRNIIFLKGLTLVTVVFQQRPSREFESDFGKTKLEKKLKCI